MYKMIENEETLVVELSWASTLEELLLTKESENYTPGTIKNYRSGLTVFANFCMSKYHLMSPEGVTKKMVRDFILDLKKTHTAGYCNSRLSLIRSYFDFLVNEEYIEEWQDPTRRIKFMETDNKIIVPFSDDEVKGLIDAASRNKNAYMSARDKLMVMILADCGLRVNELVTLLDKNVNKDSIFVHKAKRRKQRLVYVTPPVARQIIKYRRIRDAYFESKGIKPHENFLRNRDGQPLKNDGVQKMLKKLALKCDIRPTVRVSPHTFRHFFAQSQLKNGIDIYSLSKLLGHDSINTTQEYLKGLADEQLVQNAIATSPLLNMKK